MRLGPLFLFASESVRLVNEAPLAFFFFRYCREKLFLSVRLQG